MWYLPGCGWGLPVFSWCLLYYISAVLSHIRDSYQALVICWYRSCIQVMQSRGSCPALSSFNPVSVSNLSPRLSGVTGGLCYHSEVDPHWLFAWSNTMFIPLNFFYSIFLYETVETSVQDEYSLNKLTPCYTEKLLCLISAIMMKSWCFQLNFCDLRILGLESE